MVVEGCDLIDDDFVDEDAGAAEVLPDDRREDVWVDVVVVCEDVVCSGFNGHRCICVL